MFSDLHVHHNPGKLTGKKLLRTMDKVGMRRMAVLAPYMGESNERQKESTDMVAKLCAQDPKRLVAFAWIEPRLSGAVSAVEYAVQKKKIKGIKMIPHHWYPYEERLFPVYGKIEELRKPILFHSGILWGFEDSSRFCRPAFYEALLHFPKLKFALAHISWPWTDECIAVAGRMRAAARAEKGRRMQMYIDTTRGTPDLYRKDALYKAITYAGADRLIFGTDSGTGDLSRATKHFTDDRRIIVDELGFSQKDFEKIMLRNFDDFLKPMA
jgi:predicted TIM-barrel fold metal-dependent hydrolase